MCTPGKSVLLKIIGLVLVTSLFHFTTTAQSPDGAGIVYVKQTATGAGNGSSWDDATSNLQGAINASGAEKVFVAIGTYNVPSPSSFIMKDDVAIYGGFDPDNGITVLAHVRIFPSSAGVGRGSVLNGKNERPVIWNVDNNLTSSAILDGFTLTGGRGTNATSGGCIRNRNVYPTFSNLLIYDNTAANGAGIYNENGLMTLTNVAIVGNTATTQGGGIYNLSATPTLTNVTVVGNTGGASGAIYTTGGIQLNNAIVYGGISGAYTAQYSLIENKTDVTNSNLNATGILPAHIFTNLASGNYSLVTGSPVIDKGNSAFNLGGNKDLAGHTRGVGTAIDLGAYEYFAATPGANGTVYVTTKGMGAGTSWTDATGNIQAAINAVGTQQVWVAKGTYTVSASSFYMKNGIAIYGGFDPENGIDDLGDQRIIAGIDGSGNAKPDGTVLNGRSERPILWNYASSGSPMTATAVLDGFTLTAGAGGGANSSGGAIYNYYASPTLTNLTIRNNAAFSGGGIYNEQASPLITKCIFTGNTASSSGGGMYNYNHANPKLVNCLMYGNTGGPGGVGGAVFNNNTASPTLINCTLANNHSDNRGGAMYSMAYSHPVFMNAIVYGNTAANDTPGINDEGTITTTWPRMYYSLVQDRTNEDANGNVPFSGAITDIFNNPAAGNYTLKAGSPVVNRGRNSLAEDAGLSTDLAGVARIQGGRVDLGVYEADACAVPATLYVNAATTTAGGNGFSWTSAYKYLTDALDMAQQCPGVTEIRVAAGTYYPTGMEGVLFEREAAFTITRSNLTIVGGYNAGTGVRDIFANPTVLSGNVGSSATADDNSFHIMILAGIPRTDSLIIDGFTFQDAKANGFDFPEINGEYVYQDSGAGIFISNVGNNAVIRNCIFNHNKADFLGGGIYNSLSDVKITNCNFTSNEAVVFGGGGLYNDHSGSVISRCTFQNNTAGGDGGGVLSDGSVTGLSYCTFRNNTAGGSGGGIKNGTASQLSLAYCVFDGNIATTDGGGIHSANSGLLVINTSITHNSANRGGGVYNASFVNPVFVNVTVADNTASSGGAVFVESGTPQFDNAIVYGGIAGSYTPQYSLIGGYAGGSVGNLNGTTILPEQVFADPSTGDYTLKNGVAPINTGRNLLFPDLGAETKDLAGNLRLIATTIDMGAYENPDGVLPVRWISFTTRLGDDQYGILDWKVDQANVSEYQIERSSNAKDFRTVGTVAAGSSEGIAEYSFTDPTAVTGMVYYRIRQTDLDGSYGYSRIVSVSGADGIQLSAYPNPVSQKVIVELNAVYIGTSLKLTNAAGVILQQLMVSKETFEISLDKYPAGIYILYTWDGRTVKLIKNL